MFCFVLFLRFIPDHRSEYQVIVLKSAAIDDGGDNIADSFYLKEGKVKLCLYRLRKL